MADYDNRLSDYVDVPARIAEFRAKFPDGSLQPWNPDEPYRVEKVGEKIFVVVVAAAYRTPDDKRPGVGMAYEQFPGKTPYTRDSELQNAETSAWGRAIVAALAADTKRSVASQEEVRNRQADREAEEKAAAAREIEQDAMFERFIEEIQLATEPGDISSVALRAKAALAKHQITRHQNDRLARAGGTKLAELNGATT